MRTHMNSVKDHFETQELGEFSLKGLEQMTKVYEVISKKNHDFVVNLLAIFTERKIKNSILVTLTLLFLAIGVIPLAVSSLILIPN